MKATTDFGVPGTLGLKGIN